MGRPSLVAIGEQHGRLTVTGRAQSSSPNRPMWMVQCECGMPQSASTEVVQRGYFRGCNCPDALSPRGRPAGDQPLFGPERDAIIRRDWPRGVPINVLDSRVNALPGRYCTRLQIGKRARALGVARPEGYRHDDLVQTMPSPEPEPRLPGWRRRRPIPLYAMIRIGRDHGLTSDQAMDINLLNRAVRQADPDHPGYAEEGRKRVGLGNGRMSP